jgi:hypothetical protein
MQRGKVPSIAKRSSLAGAQVNTHTHGNCSEFDNTCCCVNPAKGFMGVDIGWHPGGAVVARKNTNVGG